MGSTESNAPLLELVEVTKTFGGTPALEHVSLTLAAGEVHVVAGANGAGKSTLIRVIAGAYASYEGELRLGGERVQFASPKAAALAGIATIHQELSLVPALSIADNFELGWPGPIFGALDRSSSRERARAALARLELSLDPDALVESLSVAERQLVEIARALAGNVRVLVLDEPTSALSEPDAERLMLLVERLKTQGIGCLYVSHRMHEMFRLADRITVLRDGRRVFSRPAAEITREDVVNAMVGTRVVPTAPVHDGASEAAPVRLRVRGLGCAPPSRLAGLDFDLGRGELVGVAGVEGSGARALLHALFGDVQRTHGEVTLDGEPYAAASPRAALDHGVALLASDRHDSVLAELSVSDNATLSSLAGFSPGGLLRPERERAAVVPTSERVRLKAPSLGAPARALSGGNQQKVALARCLLVKPRLLLLDDPTRGIDVGARADVHALLRELAEGGTSVLFRSSDTGELSALAERVLVLFDGRLVATLVRGELDEARLLALMMGAAA